MGKLPANSNDGFRKVLLVSLLLGTDENTEEEPGTSELFYQLDLQNRSWSRAPQTVWSSHGDARGDWGCLEVLENSSDKFREFLPESFNTSDARTEREYRGIARNIEIIYHLDRPRPRARNVV